MAIISNLKIQTERLSALESDPGIVIADHGPLGQAALRLAVPHYAERVAEHYGSAQGVPGPEMPFTHFGLICEFEQAREIHVCDAGRRLDDHLRDLVGRYGAVIFQNAYLETRVRHEAQRNIFPSLQFHIDRGATQPDRISLFFRDPFDEVHKEPRASSTLILANRVAYLQALKEGAEPHQFRSLYRLFEEEDVEALGGRILIDQTWSAPRGTGEICLIDNATVLHASYYRGAKGYPIGVRYLF